MKEKSVGHVNLWWLQCVLCLIFSAALSSGCRQQPEGKAIPTNGPILLTDATQAAGIKFVHSHGGKGRHYMVKAFAGGGAFFDYDGDGWQDVFLVQGASLPNCVAPGRLRSALYRNNKNGTFKDITADSGLDVEMYGMAPAVGDYDNDGRPDLFVSAFGGNRLFRNKGGGKFEDVTRRAGLMRKDWCTGAAWLDYDNDGRLDLFVCRYTEYSLERDRPCISDFGKQIYCDPHFYQGAHSLLYHNNGDGTFKDVTHQSGIKNSAGRSLGVACADFNGDGHTDIYVTNDMTPNLLFMNSGNGDFRETASIAGVLFGATPGKAPAGMGVDFGDYKNAGQSGIVVTNFEKEAISLYYPNGAGTFSNETSASGLEPAGSRYVKWGTRFVDLDLDGFQDLFVVNGHTDEYADLDKEKSGYAQPCQVFHNEKGAFKDVSLSSGAFFTRRQVGRGAAFGDYDNDGDTDVLVACNNQPAILLRNDSAGHHRWIRLALQGHGCNRDALGAQVRVHANDMVQTQYVRSGSSYFADHDRRLLFGIGRKETAKVDVRWPCGTSQTLVAPVSRTTLIKEIGCKSRKKTAVG